MAKITECRGCGGLLVGGARCGNCGQGEKRPPPPAKQPAHEQQHDPAGNFAEALREFGQLTEKYVSAAKGLAEEVERIARKLGSKP